MDSRHLLPLVLTGMFLVSCSAIPDDERREGILLGSADAPVIMDVYMDFRCPQCRELHDRLFPLLETGLVASGDLGVRIRDYPFLPESNISHNAAWCARENGTDEYRSYITVLLHQQGNHRIRDLIRYGEELGFGEEFATCVTEMPYADAIERIKQEGRQRGVTRTPTLFLGEERYNHLSEPLDIVRAVEGRLTESGS